MAKKSLKSMIRVEFNSRAKTSLPVKSIAKIITVVIGEKIKMELLINDIYLQDDDTSKGGLDHADETLKEFLDSVGDTIGSTGELSFAEINKMLVECGIKPITLEQIEVVGVRGE